VPASLFAVFGPPAIAENGTLIISLSDDYRSKKEHYILVPAIGRRILDLGGNVDFSFSLQALSICVEGGPTT
jgi:hypothetical protein